MYTCSHVYIHVSTNLHIYISESLYICKHAIIKTVLFEEREDGERYAGLLEAQDFPVPQVCVAVCCSVLQRVAACCSVLQCIALCCSERYAGLQEAQDFSVPHVCVAACCSVL